MNESKRFALLLFIFTASQLSGQDMVDLYHRIPTNYLPVKYDLSPYRLSNTFSLPNQSGEGTPPITGLIDLKNWYLEISETWMGSGTVTTDQVARFGITGGGFLLGMNRGQWGAMPSTKLIFLKVKGAGFIDVTPEVFPKISVSDFRSDRAQLTSVAWARDKLLNPTLVYKLPRFGTTVEVTGHMTGSYAMARMNAFEKPPDEKKTVEDYLSGIDIATLYFAWHPEEGVFRLMKRL